ncbi:hypothetical protein [Caballeronia mineralivorans]|uniref:hypothetical protein n=1 Tax=Caballeronia mineralivorans TaxID=2010198 RepID=UPI000A744C83|nr:hypothetical protein [Caballeronia mineralivorans]
MTQVVRIVIIGGGIASLVLAVKLGERMLALRSIDHGVMEPYLGSDTNYFRRAGCDRSLPFRRQPAASRNLQYMLYRRHQQALHGFRKAPLLWTARENQWSCATENRHDVIASS